MSNDVHSLIEDELWGSRLEGDTPSDPRRPQTKSTRTCALCVAEDPKASVANRALCMDCSKTAFHGGYCQDRRPLLVIIPEGTQPNWRDEEWIRKHTADA